MKLFNIFLVTLNLLITSSAFADSSCRPIAVTCIAQSQSVALQNEFNGSSCENQTTSTVRGQMDGRPIDLRLTFDGGLWGLDTTGVAALRLKHDIAALNTTIYHLTTGQYIADFSFYGNMIRMSCFRIQ